MNHYDLILLAGTLMGLWCLRRKRGGKVRPYGIYSDDALLDLKRRQTADHWAGGRA